MQEKISDFHHFFTNKSLTMSANGRIRMPDRCSGCMFRHAELANTLVTASLTFHRQRKIRGLYHDPLSHQLSHHA